ncbi:MAG: beta-galactosidase [Acidobacteria bacterium]|nr:beta-galactosidase [Acidobacteriota bacterium]
MMFAHRVWSAVFAAAISLSCAAATTNTGHRFVIANGQFELDGKPIQIISGEIHYPRIPRARWTHDLKMAKAMGLNAVTVYAFWNAHEPTLGHFDFSGNNDVAAFIREAQRQGLWVILRPGPYVCAEWEFGGFPGWLEKDHTVKLRTTDPKYMRPASQWLKRLGQELAPLQASNGGPIIAVQVENEYGSYGKDRDYMRAMRKAVYDAGFSNTLLYSTDGDRQLKNDTLPDLFTAVNFGPGKISDPNDPNFAPRRAIETLKKLRPNDPVFVGEYWDGWFDHWGSKWDFTDAKLQSSEFEWMLKQGYSVSVYMFVGGTSFGWMNGANSNAKAPYEPDVTSYDYDSVLQEDGQPSPKYFMFRDAIQRVTGKVPPPVPASPKPVSFPSAELKQSVSLWKTLPAPHHSEHPLTMEDLDQNYGYILYRTHINEGKGELNFDGIHEYADVYLNGKLAGTIERRLNQKSLAIEVPAGGAQLDVLVENTGRINFGPNLQDERIGIIGDAHFNGATLTGWDIYTLPMETTSKLNFTDSSCEGACFYRTTLKVDKPADTYLDTRSLSKGFVWVNGKPLGRFWNIGPQGSLYLPGEWLHKGANSVVVFDLYAKPGRKVAGIPVLVKHLGAGKQD